MLIQIWDETILKSYLLFLQAPSWTSEGAPSAQKRFILLVENLCNTLESLLVEDIVSLWNLHLKIFKTLIINGIWFLLFFYYFCYFLFPNILCTLAHSVPTEFSTWLRRLILFIRLRYIWGSEAWNELRVNLQQFTQLESGRAGIWILISWLEVRIIPRQ